MIVTDFEIDHFRDGPPLRVLDLGNGLNVALVHSEGGHELLFNFIPATLYGPDWPSYHSLGTACAQLTMRTEQGAFAVRRDASLERGRVRIVAPDGTRFAHGFLRDLVDRVSPANFREIFTFSLDRVARQDRSRILRMARFLRQRSPETSIGVTEVHATDLRAPRQSLNELAELIGAEASRLSPRAPADLLVVDRGKAERELKQIDTALADARQRLLHLGHEIDETQGALVINRTQARLAQVEREIARLRPIQTVDEKQASGPAIEGLTASLRECREQLKQLAEEKSDLSSQGKELASAGRVAKLLPRIEAMLWHEKALLKEEHAIEQLKLNIDNLEARLESERLEGTSPVAASGRPASEHELSRLDLIANRLREIERQQQAAEQQLLEARSQAPVASFAEPARAEVAGLQAAEKRLADLRQQVEMDDKLHRLDAERGELIARMRRLHQDQLMPVGRVAVLGALFAMGVALVIWGMFQQAGQVNWNMVLIGGGLALLVAMIKFVADRESSQTLVEERRRLEDVHHQLETLTANAAQRGLDAEALARQLSRAENEVQRLRAQGVDIAATGPAAESFATLSVEVAGQQLEGLRRRHQEVTHDWRELLIELGLPATLTAAHARDALAERAARNVSRVPVATETEMQLRATRAELERRQGWMQTLGNQARQLVKELGQAPGDGLIEQFDILRDALGEHRDQLQARRQLGRTLKRLRNRESQIKQAARGYAAKKKQAEEAARQKEEQQALKRQLTNDRLKLLDQQAETLRQDIAEIRQRYGISTSTPLAELPDAQLEQRLESQRQDQAALQEQVVQQSERRGQLRAELTARPPQGEAIIAPAFAPIVEKTKTLGQQLNQAAVPRRRNQPVASHYYLQRAARYLLTLSGGQFERIDSVDDDTLVLINAQQKGVSLDRVRREHLPNIYFSLWLARIEAYSDRGVRLPVILEDPLKVTDRRRKKPLARLLKEFGARGYQTLLVTDREAHAELFSSLEVPVADLSQRELISSDGADLASAS